MSKEADGTPFGHGVAELDEKMQQLLEKAQDSLQASIELIQPLSGGYSGALLFLAQIALRETDESKLVVLKLDRYRHSQDETRQHESALKSFSDSFRAHHLVEMAFPPVIDRKNGRVALFYEAAGHSLITFRPLRVYNRQGIVSKALEQCANDLLNEWRQQRLYRRALGFNVLQSLFETRYKVRNNHIAEVLEQAGVSPHEQGLLIDDALLPSPLAYLVRSAPHPGERELILPAGPQHGDLNVGNLLLASPRVPNARADYFLIDFLHFQPSGSCLFDLFSLELSYVLEAVERAAIPTEIAIGEMAKLGNIDTAFVLSDFSTGFAGVAKAVASLREAILSFVRKHESTYQDHWRACSSIAAVAAGLVSTNTRALSRDSRLLAYAYAAAHLKAYFDQFGLSLPTKAAHPQIEPTQPDASTEPQRDWRSFMTACNDFAPDHSYIAVVGPYEGTESESLAALGLVPWAAVIDFDPYTESVGRLLHRVKPRLSLLRFVHLLVPSKDLNDLAPDHACYWFAARGIAASTDEDVDLSWKHWNRHNAAALERFLSCVAASTIKPITLLLVWNNHDFVDDVIKMAERHFYDRVNYVFSHPDATEDARIVERLDIETFTLDLSDIAASVQLLRPPSRAAEDSVILPMFRGVDQDLSYSTLPIEIMNWLEEECEVVHVNRGLIEEHEVGRNTAFLRGRRISWFELNLHTDIDRALTPALKKTVQDDLAARDITRIHLFHHPGAGGTTVGRRVVWDLHWEYPTLVMKSVSNRTIERIRDVYTRTRQSVLLLFDSGFITLNQIENLYYQVRAAQVPAVFLIVVREFQLPSAAERIFTLDQRLTNMEISRFVSILAAEVPDKRPVLFGLTEDRTHPSKLTPFYFGLTAFEEEFHGIETFVSMRLEQIGDQERKIIGMISLTYYFGQQGIPSQVFSFLVGLPPSRTLDLRKYLRTARQDLLLYEEDSWRPIHFLVAEEILIQMLAGDGERDSWVNMLSQYAVEMIELLGDTSTQFGDRLVGVIYDILFNLFIERPTQDRTFESYDIEGRSRFSDYVEKISSLEGKRRVFTTLVEVFPYEPHFWGHFSRFIWTYAQSIPDYKKAVEAASRAIDLDQGTRPDYKLHHIKGMALAKWATHLMERAKEEAGSPPNTVPTHLLEELKNRLEEALQTFKHIREELQPTEERAYVSAIELMTRYIEFGKILSPAQTFAEFFTSSYSRDYRPYLAEAESLLRQARRLQSGISRDSRFVREREIRLDNLYDDHSRIIAGWHEMLQRDDIYRPPYRRNLVYSYLARSNREWSLLSRKEVELVKGLMEDNMLAEPGNNENVRLWFEAAKRLPYVSLDYAIEKLTYWTSNATGIDALDGYYYLYTAQSLAAIEGSNLAAVQATRTLERCKQIAQDRPNRTFSFEWVGKGKGLSRLVHYRALGPLQTEEEAGLFKDTSRLERLTGRIEKIYSQQAGSIRAYGLSFFFLPSPRAGQQFLRGRDENKPVTFFMGFSYDGPRAWDVKAT